MKNSEINWTDHTFNAWQGCTKVSPGCTNCYADVLDKRHLHGPEVHWGMDQPRYEPSDTYWKEPLAWNRAAERTGQRERVFCLSMGDWCDAEAPAGQLDRLWDMIRQTPYLDWLLLTKRAERISLSLPADWGSGYANCWLGVSVENKKHGLPRIDILREIPAAVRFLSVEPLLEDIGEIKLQGIAWCIIGGESGTKARPMDTDWVSSIIDQCRAQGVAPWVKQLGRSPTDTGSNLVVIDLDTEKKSSKGGDFEDWPDHLSHLKVREIPQVDQDAVAIRIDEVELGKVEIALGTLAASLEPDIAAKELELRTRYLNVERSMFMPRQERGKVLAEYHKLYAPLRKFTAFLCAIDVPRRTAYELIEAADESVRIPHTSPDQKPERKVAKIPPSIYDAVEQAVKSVTRSLRSLDDPDTAEALRLVIRRLAELNPEVANLSPEAPHFIQRRGQVITMPMPMTAPCAPSVH